MLIKLISKQVSSRILLACTLGCLAPDSPPKMAKSLCAWFCSPQIINVRSVDNLIAHFGCLLNTWNLCVMPMAPNGFIGRSSHCIRPQVWKLQHMSCFCLSSRQFCLIGSLALSLFPIHLRWHLLRPEMRSTVKLGANNASTQTI